VDDRPKTLVICCGAVAKEIVALVRENGWDNIDVQCLPARFHTEPDRIPEGVRAKIRAGREAYDRILVLYSDCGTGGELDRVLAEEGVERIGGSHCYEVFAGAADFAALMAAEPGSFFLTDFLARNFDKLVVQGLGLDRFPKLRQAYFGRYKEVVYLAQSGDPALEAKARAAARDLGLAFTMRRTGYGDFATFLAERQACRAQERPAARPTRERQRSTP
jgi:hypothetical protein